jgi:hypothetical protein
MRLAHLRLRRRVSLLAAGALDGRERDETRAHVEVCARCRATFDELTAVVSAVEAEAARSGGRDAVPEVALPVLLDRVQRELDRAPRAARPGRAWSVALPAVVAAAVLAILLVPSLVSRSRPPRAPARASIPPSEAGPLLTQDALDRIERNLAREQAARYLSEAREVLVSVAATGVDCDEKEGRLDVGAAPERSRQLLEKRRLLVEAGAEAVAPARGVLDDVEIALREVADLPACVKRHDVEHVRHEVERRQLLMRIRLMTRELEG